jgi:hypothetical protein
MHQMTSEEDLFVGIDLHKHRWHVTIRTFAVEVFSASIPGTWESLHRILARYPGRSLQAVYEAGYFGFRNHEAIGPRRTSRVYGVSGLRTAGCRKASTAFWSSMNF